ncbi:hypothetical protein JDV02_004062 [Purpureocillium takamizusanense]|uniref:Amine oxidase domain-containing protein n=1 Tax=Purpureocillium takamizusanense TaxID=2060973 RepID=A0A9Q8QDN2_9HYPO|nr:uncharacterized protein JDV02_004062 [Purpureocillium takamizusanense]UNI17740.1 hypothetical protein JDV02_004062 [Purpureocillium takamizusanense]
MQTLPATMALSGADKARPQRQSVAIVGTGLAGLTTAYLLHNDDHGRYDVTLFEQADELSFDSASVAVRNLKTDCVERVDLPMRACAAGYYANLMRMYSYLGIPLHPVRFLFVFANALASSASSPRSEATAPEDAGSAPGSYFVHASNLHKTPPPWPSNRGVFAHFCEILYLIVCQLWFSTICFWVPPETGDGDDSETLAEYLERVWLPRRYISHYLLPLMSSVSTCDHADMMAFPASDVVNYKRLSHGQQHYAVCGGVRQVQSKLVQGMRDIRLGCRVITVEVVSKASGDGVSVRWQPGTAEATEERFDHVVLAVSPDVATRIFHPLSTALGNMPTKWVESSVLSPRPGAFSVAHGDLPQSCSHHGDDKSPSQVITFRSTFGDGARTEALHAMPGGVLVSTQHTATVESKAVLKTAGFTRTLRTPASRAATQRVMESNPASDSRTHWVNGENDVWLAGSWCWDGMVLLEGCVVSAIRVADNLGVRIPWQ